MWGLLLKPAISSRSNKNMADIGKSCFWMTETLKIFSPKITSPIELLVVTKWILCWYKNVCKVLLQNYSFRLDPTRNMAAMGIYCFYWFVTLYKWCTRHVKSSITIPHLIKVGRVQNMTHGIDRLFLLLICWNSMYSLPTELQIQFVCNGHKWCLLYLLQIFCISFCAKYMGHVNNIYFFFTFVPRNYMKECFVT